MENKENTIAFTVNELKQFMMQVAKLGGLEAMKYKHGFLISQQQAYKQYGRPMIVQLTEAGIISPRKRASSHYVVCQYNIIEIESALTAMYIDSSIRNRMKGGLVETPGQTVVGIRALAAAYHCSYGRAKLLRNKLAAACVKQGRHIVIDLRKADKILPLPLKKS